MTNPDPRQSLGQDLRTFGAVLVAGALALLIGGGPGRGKAAAVAALGAFLWRHGWKQTHNRPAQLDELTALLTRPETSTSTSAGAGDAAGGTVIDGEARAV